MTLNKRYRSVLARVSVVLWCALAFGGCSSDRPQFESVDISGADYAHDFALTDNTGAKRTLADFRGKLVVIFFGYTQCPDVCPTTMADLATVMKDLGPDAQKVQVLFVTLDPERDTAKVLSAYVPAFDPHFLGLYGSEQDTAKVAREFKIFYQKVDGPTPTSYTLDHSAGSYVFDKAGQVRLFMRNAEKTSSIEHDLKILLAS